MAACCAARESKGATAIATPKLKILDSVRTYVTPFTLHDFGAEGVYWVAVGAREAIGRLSCLVDGAVEALVSEVVAMCAVQSPMWTRMSQAPFRPFFALMREAFKRGLAGGSGHKKVGGETISDK